MGIKLQLLFMLTLIQCDYSKLQGLTGTQTRDNPAKVQSNTISSECPIFEKFTNESVLLLSDAIENATTAIEKCSLVGGNLVDTKTTEMYNLLIQSITNKYTKDLQREWIFYDKSDQKRRFYKYSTNPNEEGNWVSTKHLGNLSFVDLFRSHTFPTANMDRQTQTSVYFCKNFEKKWRVTTENCDGHGWTKYQILYGGNKASSGYKPVFLYNGQASGSSSVRMTSQNSTYLHYTKFLGQFYIPDIKVMVGAHWVPSQQKWIWSDGSIANFSKASTNCQQKVLHYKKNWGYSKIKCISAKAYYACQTKLSVSASICNFTTVTIHWTNNWADQPYNIIMQVNIDGQSHERQYTEQKMVVHDLKPYKSYNNVKVKAIFTKCSNKATETKIYFETGQGASDNVTGAKLNSSYPCLVSISKKAINNVFYKIAANTDKTNLTINASLENSTTLIPTEQFEPGTWINITVQAVSCGAESVPTPVGRCRVPIATTQTPIALPPGANTSMIVGIAMSILIIAVLIVTVLVYMRKKRRDEIKTNTNGDTAALSPQPYETTAQRIGGNNQGNRIEEVEMENIEEAYVGFSDTKFIMKEKYKEKLRNKSEGFKKEFEALKNAKTESQEHKHSQLPENKDKNRYKNIYSYDFSRVVLQGKNNGNYINASFINGYSAANKFIASQGPKPNTVDDFWLMVWQQNVTIIVMLTNLREKDKQKCEKYWPDLQDSIKFAGFTIDLNEETNLGGIIQRKLTITFNKETKHVTHYQYISWPDHGIPHTTSTIINLREMVEEVYDSNNPIVVHCSAGVGRTGTYIASDILFDELDKEGTANVLGTITGMRQRRTEMVQTLDQYKFIYKLAMEHELIKPHKKTATELQYMTDSDIYQSACVEFNLLNNLLENPSKEYEKLQVSTWNPKNQEMFKLSASFLQDFGCSTNFIAAVAPNSATQEMFWKAMCEQQVAIAICLETFYDDGVANTKQSKIEFGDICISLQETTNNGNQVTSKILNVKSNGPPMIKEKIHFIKVEQPRSPEAILQAIDMMETSQRQHQKNGRVLVYCKDGCNMSGVVIATVHNLEQLKTQNKVDVISTVKDLCAMRRDMVNDMGSYMLIYKVLLKHIESFDLYANYK